jgi:hypothetical protein
MSQPSSCCAASWRNQGQAVKQKSQTQCTGCCDKKVAYHGVAPGLWGLRG